MTTALQKTFWLDNLRAARAEWLGVEPRLVFPSLAGWSRPHKCGSQHCFGGWLPYFEHFKKLGVKAFEANGAPVMSREDAKPGVLGTAEPGWFRSGIVCETSLAYYLFGSPGMFSPTVNGEYRIVELTAAQSWQYMLDKLDIQINELEAVDAIA